MKRPSDARLRALLGRMCDIVPSELADHGYQRKDICILTTRVATLLLREQGVRARPLACQLMAGNATWARLVTEYLERDGRWPTADEWVEGMWSVGVGYGQDARRDRPGYDGHVITVVEERYGLDLTLEQVSRPEHGFTTGPSYFKTPRQFLTADVPLPVILGDAYLRYDALPAERAFLTTPDWQETGRHWNQDDRVPAHRIRQRLTEVRA